MGIVGKIIGRSKKNVWQTDMRIRERQTKLKQEKLSNSLDANIKKIEFITGSSSDLHYRKFTLAGKFPCALVHFEAMTNTQDMINLLKSLMERSGEDLSGLGPEQIVQAVANEYVVMGNIQIVNNLAALFTGLSAGHTAILFSGTASALLCDTEGLRIRNVTEPNAEVSIRGPRDGFTESMDLNITMIRRRIRVPHLWMETQEIGDLTQTRVTMAYIKGLARDTLVEELRSRLKSIDIDGVIESGYIEDFIADTSRTLFPLVLRTERPDKATAALLEGRVAILVDGTPHTLIVPVELPMFLQAPDDYYEPPPIGTLTRTLRWLAMFIALLLPALYVSFVNFHHGLLPTSLFLRIVSVREGVPFPVVAEVLIMEVLFEVLREAGIRLPASIGPAISIVGALVLGEAAIQAGIVSPAVVIVIAMTAITGFTTPVFSISIAFRILRFIFTALGAMFGLLGIQIGIFLLAIHVCALRSFGVPYMTPYAPMVVQDMDDAVIRDFWWRNLKRPRLIGGNDPQRKDAGQRPSLKRQKRR